jgi:hypothetical protein
MVDMSQKGLSYDYRFNGTRIAPLLGQAGRSRIRVFSKCKGKFHKIQEYHLQDFASNTKGRMQV